MSDDIHGLDESELHAHNDRGMHHLQGAIGGSRERRARVGGILKTVIDVLTARRQG